MIGKYADEEFFEKLTTKEQREYLVSLVKDMSNDQAKELYDNISDLRFEALRKLNPEDYNNPDVISRFWDMK